MTELAVVKDMWDAILGDSWMWMVVWGKPRSGKTTVQMQLAYAIYKDWDHVLQSFVYNLAGLLYKMDNGIPCRIMTRNAFHDRVPILLADDFGAGANKAKTQHEPAWDIFKGMFDTLATKIAVLIASMGSPSAMTQQIANKYTHEIFVTAKGCAKYDEVDWYQNYQGWQAKQNKKWIQTFDFYPIPEDVYKEYDGMRLSLVDELEQLIKDKMAESQLLLTMKRMQEVDFEFIQILYNRGGVSNDWMNQPEHKKYKPSLMRSKARSLAIPLRKGTAYWYDISDLGLEVLNAWTSSKKEEEIVKPLES